MPAASSELHAPSAFLLTRIDERLSFLYLQHCSIRQNDYGTVAMIETADGPRRTQLPVATLTVVLLGPGTSITQQAAASMSKSGCAVTFVGGGGVRCYGAFLSPYASTLRLQAQAVICTDTQKRAVAARRLYAKRFPDIAQESAMSTSVETLRGVEGARMRAVYRDYARRARLRGWRRNTGTDPSLGAPDSVNRALNAANSALYGIVNAVVLALGMSPGLGIIHTGNRQSFTLDIADIYKTEVTIPLAFTLHASSDPENEALQALRKRIRLIRMLPRIVHDIDDVLGLDTPDDIWDEDILDLWGEDGNVTGNYSHASETPR